MTAEIRGSELPKWGDEAAATGISRDQTQVSRSPQNTWDLWMLIPPYLPPKKGKSPRRLQVKLHLTMKHDHICEAKLRVLVVRKWGMPYAAFGTALCAMPVCPRKPQVSQNLRVKWCCMGFRGTNAQYFPPKVRPSLLGWWLCMTNDYCCKTWMDAKLIIIVDVYSWRW